MRQTRERILEATCEMLREQNLSLLSVERIAQRAGLAKRTVFLHFNSKDELLAEALSYLRHQHDDAMHEWSLDFPKDMTAEDRIEEIFVKILAIIREPDWRGSAFIRLSGELAERRGHPIHQVIADAKNDQQQWLERELARGNFRLPAVLAAQLTIIMTGLFQMQLIDPSSAPGEAVLQLIPVLLAANRKQPSERADQGALEAP